MDLHHKIWSLNCLVAFSCLMWIFFLFLLQQLAHLLFLHCFFHSAVSNNLTSPLVPAYSSPASSQIPTSQEMRFLSSNVDCLPNKLSELSFCMISGEVDVAAITKVSPKNTLSVFPCCSNYH